MKPRRIRDVALVSAAFVLAASAAGCISTEQPTPIYVYLTPSPEVTADVATPSPTPTLMASPSASASASESAGPTATAWPPDSDLVEATGCVGSASNRSFLAEAAQRIKGSVYCATGLGKGWFLTTGNWRSNAHGGWADIIYVYKKTNQTIEIKAGAFCIKPDPNGCTGALHLVQAGVAIGGASADLMTTGAAGNLEIVINPGKYNALFLITRNLPQATAVSVAANLRRVNPTVPDPDGVFGGD